jgi:ketosteroid isomerase-like protein
MQTLAPGGATPPHYHECEEVIVVLRGSGQFLIAGHTIDFGSGTTLVAEPKVVHQLTNTGSDEMFLIAGLSETPARVFAPDGSVMALPWSSSAWQIAELLKNDAMQTIKKQTRNASIAPALLLMTVALSMQLAAAQESNKGGKAIMLPQKPEDWPGAFVKHLNAGHLDAVMTLYEPEAQFVAKSGETLVGHDAIRKVLGALIAAKAHFQSRVVRAVTVGDIAQLYTDFEGTRVDESGKTVPVRNNAIEVLRRQPDGTWKLIMGDPNGRGWKS